MKIHTGWFPGVVGDIAALHARHYAASHGFGAVFEAKVARELGAFLTKPASSGDFFRAVERDGHALGSIALEDEGEGLGHLRWFILDAALRGSGLGRRLLGEALDHARARGLTRVYLWTLDGLPAAARLYAEAGFAEAERLTATQWGKAVTELRLEWVRPASA
ncbi:GNAT family N-acetyltransferase [Roseococcus sp. SDR]|uniref:GNAT family N-acetyltransferase n=1 Tax=Roseococcus sp. SDR TaxID=2835532 RepID=UPI001BCB6DAE|nr:GNAT family N-acetyltransferase [Roseococcus sp. SDR]MBS7792364.1 GNAT family N-acetyltransferase [Roseococcus sp. SDR]MBV1847678.1 GNAT family N-acetyltransferase [Roseococcus sp. SDR]